MNETTLTDPVSAPSDVGRASTLRGQSFLTGLNGSFKYLFLFKTINQKIRGYTQHNARELAGLQMSQRAPIPATRDPKYRPGLLIFRLSFFHSSLHPRQIESIQLALKATGKEFWIPEQWATCQ